jgi:hypothetical protein
MTRYRVGIQGKWVAKFHDEQQARRFARAEAERLDTLAIVIERTRFDWIFNAAYPEERTQEARVKFEAAGWGIWAPGVSGGP